MPLPEAAALSADLNDELRDVISFAARSIVRQKRIANAQAAQPRQKRQRRRQQPIAPIQRAVQIEDDVANLRQTVNCHWSLVTC